VTEPLGGGAGQESLTHSMPRGLGRMCAPSRKPNVSPLTRAVGVQGENNGRAWMYRDLRLW
jgi:hypothetical protein